MVSRFEEVSGFVFDCGCSAASTMGIKIMTTRNPLKQQLANAWTTTIRTHYDQQQINSEHGLQVYYCAALLKEFGDDQNRRLFVEPRIEIRRKTYFPDVVICNACQIIGLVELKYAPRANASQINAGIKKDMATLFAVSANSHDIVLRNDRHFGPPVDDSPYQLAEDAILCWAGVYNGRRLDENILRPPQPSHGLLQMDALTAGDRPATICIGADHRD